MPGNGIPKSHLADEKNMSRHAVFLGLVLILFGSSTASAQATGKPNILVFWGDDIGTWNISHNNRGMMGYETPNIDRIAREGVAFTDYYGQQSCTAGRAAFIGGNVPVRTGMTKVGMPAAPEGWQKTDVTMATVLKSQGYATGQFGKNHQGDRDEHLPTMHGFDEFLGNLYHLNAEEEPEHRDYPGDMVLANGKTFRQQFGPRGVLKCKADGKGGQTIEDTGPLTRKRMETIDEETLAAAKGTSRGRKTPANRSSAGGTPRACTSART
jgi:arylsulfatase A-like enzyme